MIRILRSLPLAAALLAALECVLTRGRLPWRDLGPELFLQALLLWGAFGLLALLPAHLCLRRFERSGPRPGAELVVLLSWMVAPVLAHGVIDRHVEIGAALGALLRPAPWLEVAGALLVLGVLAWLAATALPRATPSLRRALALVLLAVACAVGLWPLDGAAGTRTDTAAPIARGESGAPNLLLLVWDTCRADRLSAYGYGRPTTPHLDRMVEESWVFEDSVSVSSFTFTSHLSMLTGVRPSTHGARLLSMRYDPTRARSVAERLSDAGYRTGAFVGTDVLAGRTGFRAGFEAFDDGVDPPVCDTYAWALVHDLQAVGARLVPALRGNGSPHGIQDFQRPASEVLARALEWIEADDPRPWFCLVNLYDVHWPYLPLDEGRQLVSPYDGPVDGYLFRSDAWRSGYEMTADDRRHVSELYDGELLELDREVDGFLGALDLAAGGTAVLLTSDHGEAFGEAGAWKHEDVGEAQLRVPLLLRLPEPAPAGRRVAAPVSGIDLAPTLLELAGLGPADAGPSEAASPERMEGTSLLGPLAMERVVLAEDRDHLDPADVRVALYRSGWKLVRRGLGEGARHELYHLASDPGGLVDLADREPERLAELRALLEEARRAADAAEATTQGLGAGMEGGKDLEGLRALGYAGD